MNNFAQIITSQRGEELRGAVSGSHGSPLHTDGEEQSSFNLEARSNGQRSASQSGHTLIPSITFKRKGPWVSAEYLARVKKPVLLRTLHGFPVVPEPGSLRTNVSPHPCISEHTVQMACFVEWTFWWASCSILSHLAPSFVDRNKMAYQGDSEHGSQVRLGGARLTGSPGILPDSKPAPEHSGSHWDISWLHGGRVCIESPQYTSAV